MKAYPMMHNYTVIAKNKDISIEMGLSYNCKIFYASLTGTNVGTEFGTNKPFVTYKDFTIDVSDNNVKIDAQDEANIYNMLRLELLSRFNKVECEVA